MSAPLAHTYSIVAYDPELKQYGVAVQTHWFCVGSVVGWAESGVGVVATQSFTEISYGPLGLSLMKAGKTAEQALNALLAADSNKEVRQVAIIDKEGVVAAHTGSKCIAEAGHRIGKNYSVQANLMLKDTVWDVMSEVFEDASGDLTEKMLLALEAAEGEGGDIRGKQSAYLLIVSSSPSSTPWNERIHDLRVDDHLEPLKELRRLLSISRAYDQRGKASDILTNPDVKKTEFEKAKKDCILAAQTPELSGNPELLFWSAVDLVNVEDVDSALPLFNEIFRIEPHWRELVPRLVPAGLLPDDKDLVKRIIEVK